MRPPICDICGKRFDPERGALVAFKMTSEDRAWKRRAESEPRFVGHPPWLQWFCEEHAEFFKAHSQLTFAEAKKIYLNDAKG